MSFLIDPFGFLKLVPKTSLLPAFGNFPVFSPFLNYIRLYLSSLWPQSFPLSLIINIEPSHSDTFQVQVTVSVQVLSRVRVRAITFFRSPLILKLVCNFSWRVTLDLSWYRSRRLYSNWSCRSQKEDDRCVPLSLYIMYTIGLSCRFLSKIGADTFQTNHIAILSIFRLI